MQCPEDFCDDPVNGSWLVWSTRTLGAYGPLVLEYGDCFFVLLL